MYDVSRQIYDVLIREYSLFTLIFRQSSDNKDQIRINYATIIKEECIHDATDSF